MPTATSHKELGPVSALLAGERFQPAQPRTLEETGLPELLVEGLICKYLAQVGNASGRTISQEICLSYSVLEERFHRCAPGRSCLTGVRLR